MEVLERAERNMLRLSTLQLVVAVLWRAADCRSVLEGLQRFSTAPTYLPVSYRVLNAESAFFLKEANQDIMRNSSLQSRAEPFFVYQARRTPLVNASYGPLSAEQPVGLELLQSPGSFVTSSMFTFNWQVQTFVVSDRVHLSEPKVQVLFYLAGRDWDDYSTVAKLPCVTLFAFHETQEVRGACRLQGALGTCVGELEPPAGWFGPPSVVPGRQKPPELTDGTPVEMYYMLRSSEGGDCMADDARKGNAVRSDQEALFGSSSSSPMKRIGSVRLYQSAADVPLKERRLDGNFAVLLPSRPVRQRDAITAYLTASASSTVETFTLRVKLKEGVAFLGARPSNAALWTVIQDARSEGHRVVTLHCRRKEPSYGQRTEGGPLRILQVDLEVDSFLGPLGSRSISWQVEYPGTRILTEEAETEIYLQKDLGGIVPLAMDTEILNTAVLTGKTVAVPVKVVTVGGDGSVTDVSEAVECRSADDDVVKVSDRCDYVFVNGKEMRGKVRMAVNFSYGYLSGQLELTVWIPRLPLQIEVSDSELSQIRGWRVPVASANQRSARDSEDEDDEDRRGRGCTLQYQSAMVRVLTHFVAEPADPRGQLTFMLGSDWQVDVTDLVRDFLKVEDPHVAQLQDGRVLVGLDPGMTTIQVMSPLSDFILAEKTVTVLEDRVSITELGVQLVSGLSLSLQLSPGSNRAIVATATTQEVLQSPKQEALISAWLQFSDGSTAPLDLYSPDAFVLSATSLDQDVVSVRRDPAWKWPILVTEAEGQGMLVRVEMTVREACQKSKRRSVLAAGNGNVQAKFGRTDYGAEAEEPDNRAGDHHRSPALQDNRYYGSSISNMEDGAMRRGTTTTKTAIVRRPDGGELSVQSVDFSDFPAQVELPREGGGGRGTQNDLLQTPRPLTDLEIGMYALLGVFCLAILVFLINCVSYALKYRHKELSPEGQEAMNHAHDWVWLGNEAEMLESRAGLSPQPDELAAMMDSGAGFEEGSHLLNGGQKNVQGQVHRAAESGCPGKDQKSDSPTTKRKRVKFTTFTAVPPDKGCPSLNPLIRGPGEDIQWVCQDVELGDSKELRNYMESLNENSLKDVA